MYYTIGKQHNGSFVISGSSGLYYIIRYSSFGRNLINPEALQTLDYVDNGQIFCNLDFISQNIDRLETINNGQIFYGAK